MGVLTGLAIALHNFPEGLATFIATLADPSLGQLVGAHVNGDLQLQWNLSISVDTIDTTLSVLICPHFRGMYNCTCMCVHYTIIGIPESVGVLISECPE